MGTRQERSSNKVENKKGVLWFGLILIFME